MAKKNLSDLQAWTRADLEAVYPELEKVLSAPDRLRLRKLLNLMRREDSVIERLAVLKELFPEKDGKPASNSLSAFTTTFNAKVKNLSKAQQVNILAGKGALSFMGPSRVASKVEHEVGSQVEATESATLKNLAVPLDTEQPYGKQREPVRLVAINAVEESELIEEILSELRVHWKSSRHFLYEAWDRTKILTGENSEEEIQKAVSRAQVILCFLSPRFFADDKIVDQINTLAEVSHRQIVPVVLKEFPVDRLESIGVPEDLELFRHQDKGYHKLDHTEREEFSQDLNEEVEKVCQKRVARRNEWIRQSAQDPDVPDPEKNKGRLVDLDGRFAINEDSSSSSALPAIDLLTEWALKTQSDCQPFAAVLEEFGMGKTTTLKFLARELIEDRKTNPDTPLPIYFDLRDLSLDLRKEIPSLDECLNSMITRAANRKELPFVAEDFRHLVEVEGAIVIFDGLDEKLVGIDVEQGNFLLKELWKILPGQTRDHRRKLIKAGGKPGKMILSCRSHFFRTLGEQAGALVGQRREVVKEADYKALIILPFNDDQIRAYLSRKVGEEAVDVVLKMIAGIHNLNDLAPRPFFLSLISKQISRLERDLLAGREVRGVTLYDNIIDDSLDRDEGKHRLLREHKPLLMEKVASALWASGRRRWSWDELFA